MDWCTSHIWSAYEYWHVSTSAKTYVLSAGEIGSLRTLDFHFLSHLQLPPQFSILWDTDIYFYKCSSIWYQHSISYMLKVRFCINKRCPVVCGAQKGMGYHPKLRRYARFHSPRCLRLVFTRMEQRLPRELNSRREAVNYLNMVQ